MLHDTASANVLCDSIALPSGGMHMRLISGVLPGFAFEEDGVQDMSYGAVNSRLCFIASRISCA